MVGRIGGDTLKRNWTAKEYEYLTNNWGKVSLGGIAAYLNRSENAIKIKAQRLGLGAFLEAGDYITFNQLSLVMGSGTISTYKLTSWVKNRGFPVKSKKVGQNRFRVVYLEDFWKWAEENRAFVDFAKLEKNSLGKEPDWLKEQRKADIKKAMSYKMTPWTPAEDNELKRLLKTYRYTYHDLAKRLSRTCGAIQRRICDLGLKERPLKVDNMIKWTESELSQLAELIKCGMPYSLIAEELNKSDKAIRGKVYAAYKTENLDFVMKMIGSGGWGDGKPIPLVRHEIRKAETKRNIAALGGLLLLHRNNLSHGNYWQKDMCMHWHEMRGCMAKELSCDECTSFQRIRPQYCKRCGITFWKREEKEVCDRCAEMRKKQAQRKFAILHKSFEENE